MWFMKGIGVRMKLIIIFIRQSDIDIHDSEQGHFDYDK